MSDMQIWEKSEAYFVSEKLHGRSLILSCCFCQEYLGFVLAINEAVKGKSNSLPGVPVSANVQKVIDMLDNLDTMIDETPPIKQPQRFGNQAFRTWYEKLREVNTKIHL